MMVALPASTCNDDDDECDNDHDNDDNDDECKDGEEKMEKHSMKFVISHQNPKHG